MLCMVLKIRMGGSTRGKIGVEEGGLLPEHGEMVSCAIHEKIHILLVYEMILASYYR